MQFRFNSTFSSKERQRNCFLSNWHNCLFLNLGTCVYHLSFRAVGRSENQRREKSKKLCGGHICPPGKFFIISMEFDKNISDWRYDWTDHKSAIDFFMRLVKWLQIAVKKCQNLMFKVNFQCQKSLESF